MMPELQPCPFCGSTTAPTVMNQNEAQWLDNDAKNLSMVVCCAAKKFGCGASTGFCDTAEQAIEAWNKRASDWIPCSERLPEDGERILICVNLASHESVQPDTCIEDGGYMYLDSGYSFGKEVTHWMPFPLEPPKEVNDQ